MSDSSIYQIDKDWVLSGSFPFLSFTLDYLQAFPESHRLNLIKNHIEIVPVTYIFAFCLFVWLIQLKCVSGSHAILRDSETEDLEAQNY